MKYGTLEPDHIEDFLVNYRKGQWFGWSDTKNKIYENLIVHDGGTKPTKQECIDGLQAMKDDYIATQYKRDRLIKYPDWRDFADAMYWNSKGDSSKLTAYYAACEKVKTDNPKPS